MKDSIKDKAIYWVTCQKEGLTLQEKEELNLWLESNIKHKKAFDEAKKVLKNNKEKLEKVAKALVEKESLNQEEFEELLK